MGSILNVDQIGHSTSGTTALTVDSSGRILTPARPAFMVYRTNASSAGVNDHITFNNTEFDIGSNWNTNYFLAPVAGVYYFGWNCFATNSDGALRSASSAVVVNIEKSTDSGSNWTQIFEGVSNTSSSYREQFCLNGLIKLAVNDRVRCFVTTGWVFMDALRERNTFSGYLVG